MLNKHAKQLQLNINSSKTKVIYINSTTTAPIHVNGAPLQFVEDYLGCLSLGSLGSLVSTLQKDIRARFGRAQGTFCQLHSILGTKQYSLKTKMLLHLQQCQNLSSYMAQSVAVRSVQTWGDWRSSITDVSDIYVRSFGPTKYPNLQENHQSTHY